MISQIKVVRSDQQEFIFSLMGYGSNWVFLQSGLDGFGSFEKEISTVNKAKGHGDIMVGSRIGKKDRTIRATNNLIRNNDKERLALTRFFRPDDEYKVYITYGGRTLWREAEIYKFNCPTPPDITNRLDVEIVFLFPDPLWKSYDNFGKNIAGKTATGGFPYIAKRTGAKKGHTTGVLDFTREVTLVNDGDVSSEARVEIGFTGDVVNPKLIINDHYVRMLETYHEGDVLVMDFEQLPPRVTLNGVNRLGYGDRTSQWEDMSLELGANIIKYDADTGNNLMRVTVFYNKRYAVI